MDSHECCEYVAIVWILWISVGATTLSQGNRLFKGSQCSDFSVVLPDAKEICDDVHPIAIVAFVNFALREYPGPSWPALVHYRCLMGSS